LARAGRPRLPAGERAEAGLRARRPRLLARNDDDAHTGGDGRARKLRPARAGAPLAAHPARARCQARAGRPPRAAADDVPVPKDRAHERPTWRLISSGRVSPEQFSLEQPAAASACEPGAREAGVAESAPSRVLPSDEAIAEAMA